MADETHEGSAVQQHEPRMTTLKTPFYAEKAALYCFDPVNTPGIMNGRLLEEWKKCLSSMFFFLTFSAERFARTS